MRSDKDLFRSMGVLATMLVMTIVTPLLALQDAPIKVDVQTTESHTVWYANPVWIAIGALALVVIIALAIMASRNRGGGNTTVIR